MHWQILPKSVPLERTQGRRRRDPLWGASLAVGATPLLLSLACGTADSDHFNLSGLPDVEASSPEGEVEPDDGAENHRSGGDSEGEDRHGESGNGSSDAPQENESVSSSTSAEEESSKSDIDAVFDVSLPDHGGVPDDQEDLETSYIWIANSHEGTISKIDTRTIEEKGRYWVHSTMDPSTNPSRTSVDLNGNVAVSLRSGAGGVTKFYASRSSCKDRNGSGKIISSHDENPLDWDDEECRAWHVEFDYAGQRGLAWTQGFLNPETQKYEGQDLWVTANNPSAGMPTEVFLLDGDTGDVVEKVVFGPGHLRPGARLGNGGYGGVVDSKGDFWFTPKTAGFIGHVSLESFEPTAYALMNDTYGAAYGIAIDSNDVLWTCAESIYRFDPKIEDWMSWSLDMGRPDVLEYGVHGGCMIDSEGILWAYGNPSGDPDSGVYGFDTETLQPIKSVPVPARIVGISIDFDGFVWGVELYGTRAFRIDTVRSNYEVFEGLVGAYTYSDMTGFALASTLPPGVE